MIPSEFQPVANHLWQSTLFAAVAGLLTLVLRQNRARARYWLWFAASVKFLVAFSLLVVVGSHLGSHRSTTKEAPVLSFVIEQASQPFSGFTSTAAIPVAHSSTFVNWIPALLYSVWAIGFVALSVSWWRRWRRLLAALRAASPIDLQIGIPAMISPAFAEPGVFGIRQPILLLPAGIADRLTPAELRAIVAHEYGHIQRHDNLFTAIHMGVEALFWFHPLVWWLGARLIEERERACDEEVLLLGHKPQVYAEGILKICELYLESPLECVSGVTGANLRKRIEKIMSNRVGARLTFAKKAFLAISTACAVAAPVIVGIIDAPASRAQSTSAAVPKFEVASVKLSKDCGGSGRGGRRSGGVSASPGRLHVCNSVQNLIADAYVAYADGLTNRTLVMRLAPTPVSGGPGWIQTDRYLIDAKVEGATSQEMMHGPMMQALLEDRFHLRIRRRTEEVPAYALTVAGDAKLQPFHEGACVVLDPTKLPRPTLPPGQQPCVNGVFVNGKGGDRVFQAQGINLDRFAALIGWAAGRPIVNRTGISGLFDFRLEFAPDEATPTLTNDSSSPPDAPSDEPAGASIFAALRQLGLKLEPARGSRELLIIDHVERPSAN